MAGITATERNLRLGVFVVPMYSAARTDRGTDGEVAAYVSGSDIVLQIYSAELEAWKSVTLT